MLFRRLLFIIQSFTLGGGERDPTHSTLGISHGQYYQARAALTHGVRSTNLTESGRPTIKPHKLWTLILRFIGEFDKFIEEEVQMQQESLPMVMADVTVITEMMKEEETRIKGFLEKLGQKLKDRKSGGKVKSVGGSPGEVICKVANDEHADLIVTGTRGMGTIRRTFLGSISDYIIHHAHVPVLVCRHKDHQHHH
ncbi:uncharacterized protein LOC132759948 [Ruditapes philippinarum]|uniref:uncharacterized protein LOC132759948 n=1 Tax=Ruditapes philippinarum TaxID=129788 RepID=UPI00295A6556|nr:uncharacterized protein LOC132759948 [Ruditapes philippinarum]